MKWYEYLVLIIILWVLFVTFGQAKELTSYSVYDREAAIRVQTEQGDHFICLLTGEGYGFTHQHPEWIGFTCAKIGTAPLLWQFCRARANQPLLECLTPGLAMKGVLPSPRNKPDIELGVF